jgi:ABC-type polysaccharide/polyol phosphate export permease
MFLEVAKYRGLLGMLAWRDIRVRYKQSLLGFAWAFLMPLIQAMVLFAIFSFGPMRVDPASIKQMPYLLFVLIGVVAWGLFQGTVASSLESLTRNSRLVTKIYFPREVFPLATLAGTLVDFCIACLVIVPFYIYFALAELPAPLVNPQPGPMLLLLPLVLLIQVLFIAGLSLALSMANLFFRDVKYVMTFVLQLWFFATNIVYPIKFTSHPELRWVAALNPMIPILDAYRDILMGVAIENVAGLIMAAVLALFVFTVGWWTFHKAEFKFAEYV